MNKSVREETGDVLKINNIGGQMISTQIQRKRQVFTSKLRTRPLPTSKTLTKPESRQLRNDSSQFYRESEQSFPQLPKQNVKQIAKLQLQDFIKVFITGKGRLTEEKESQIIRSLNGTWFKNVNNDRHIHNLYNSLPLKKQRDLAKRKKLEDQKYQTGNLFMSDQYRPPNLFPKRKSSPKVLSLAKGRDLHNKSQILSTKAWLDEHKEVSNMGLQRSSVRQNVKTTNKYKRSSSLSARNKSMQLYLPLPENYSGCLNVKKMVIHD